MPRTRLQLDSYNRDAGDRGGNGPGWGPSSASNREMARTRSVRSRYRLATTENPKRPGTAAARRFDVYFDVVDDYNTFATEDALERGAKRSDIRNDEAKGFIEPVEDRNDEIDEK